MIHLVVIRHAQTAWNVGEGEAERFRGTVDLPLSETGVQQALATSERLAHWPLAAVYTSPLCRASDMARLIAQRHSLQAEPLADLSSISYGAWVGRTHAEVRLRWPELYLAWRHDPFTIAIPGAEEPAPLRQRVRRVADLIRARHRSGDCITLVSHQAITKSLTCELLGLPGTAYWRVRHDLCGLNLFELEPAGSEGCLERLNDALHLERSPLSGTRGCRILLVRHGQTDWNAPASPGGARSEAERFRGRTDLPLSSEGVRQAQTLAEWLAGEPVTAVYASPLQRTQQTAQPLASVLGLQVGILEGLLDLDYGEWSGLSYAEAAERTPHLFAAWQGRPGSVTFPGGESLAAVSTRALGALESVAARHPGEVVLLVGHQMVNKVLISALLGLDADSVWRVGQATGAVNVLQRGREGWRIRAVNLGPDDPAWITAR